MSWSSFDHGFASTRDKLTDHRGGGGVARAGIWQACFLTGLMFESLCVINPVRGTTPVLVACVITRLCVRGGVHMVLGISRGARKLARTPQSSNELQRWESSLGVGYHVDFLFFPKD